MFKIKAPDGRNNISGKKVKQYRLAKKMSQYKLAAKIQAMGYDVDNHFDAVCAQIHSTIQHRLPS